MKKSIFLIFAVTALILISGCFTVPKEEITIFRYAMESSAEFTPADAALPICLRIAPFGAAAIYRGNRVIFKDDAGHTNHYYYHRWLAPPEDQLADLLAQNFFDWNLWGKGIFFGESGFMPTHEIRCQLDRLIAVNIKHKYSADMTVEVFFSTIDPKSYEKILIFQKKYTLSTPREDNTAVSFIKGCNTNIDEWMKLLREDLYTILMNSRQTPYQQPAVAPAPADTTVEQIAPAEPLPPPTEEH